MAAKNVYANINELIKDYYSQPVDDYLNQTVTINEVSLDCDIYRVNNNSELTANVFTGCIAEDANTQIIIGSNLSVANGTTLTPPYRCKGIIIGCPGTFTNAGTISMTARGASGAGKNIQLTDDYMISAVGGTGGAGVNTSTGGSGRGVDGLSGNSPSTGIISCGGGGSGAGYRANNSPTTGAGGNGTSFSGGAGGGAAIGSTDGGTNGSSTGGAGGNGVTYNGSYLATCGAGNPRGSSMRGSIVIPATDSYMYFDEEGTGTGGLIVILSNFFINKGTIKAEGSKARGINSVSSFHQSTGGSSGGGCVCIISVTSDNTGTISTAGGVTATNIMESPGSGEYAEYGGAGGAGTYANLTVEDLVLVDPTELQLALTVKSALDNIEPVSGRLIGLIDDDELMYEYQGTRHRAMNTDVDLSVIHAPGTAHNATDGSPVGTIISFFGYTAPSGYLACDGTEYTKADYPYLATHLADLDNHYSTTQYVGSDSDHFKVPDLRGEFLRGSGTNGHTKQGNGANVGVHQDGTNHIYIQNDASAMYIRIPTDGQTNLDYDVQTAVTGYRGGNINGSYSTTDHTSYTSRPTNTSVLYCIKYN